jgi:hypothetical protein
MKMCSILVFMRSITFYRINNLKKNLQRIIENQRLINSIKLSKVWSVFVLFTKFVSNKQRSQNDTVSFDNIEKIIF